MGAGGEGRAGTSPAGALAHLPCCHTNGDTIRVGLKDGGGRFFFFGSGGRGVMEGQKRTKGAGSCQGKRDGSGTTGTDLNGRHLLGYAGCFFLRFKYNIYIYICSHTLYVYRLYHQSFSWNTLFVFKEQRFQNMSIQQLQN